MYELVQGPLVWLAFIVFIGGCLYKLVSMHFLAKAEKSVYPTMSTKFGLRSVFHWITPFGSRNMRMHPVVTVVSFVFHFCLIITPLFVMGHAVLWQASWGISWWSLSADVADVMTALVIVCGLILFLRRLASPEVRNVSTYKDYLLLLMVIAPFVTGFIAHHQWVDPKIMVIFHILAGILCLIAIPFTWISRMLWFFFSGMYMGSESGSVRNARDW